MIIATLFISVPSFKRFISFSPHSTMIIGPDQEKVVKEL
jgi:hypothetical protein